MLHAQKAKLPCEVGLMQNFIAKAPDSVRGSKTATGCREPVTRRDWFRGIVCSSSCYLLLAYAFMEKKKFFFLIQCCIFKTFCDTANIYMELEMLLDTFLPPP